MPGGVNSTVGSAYQLFINGSLGIENTFATGTLTSVVDLFQLTPGSVGSPSTFLGAFRLSDSGVLTFSPNPADFGSGPQNAEVALSSATYSVQEDGGNAVVTLNRTVNTTTAFTVTVSTTDGTATAANDYTALSNVSVSFDANDTTKTVNIPVVDRTGFQGSRAFSVSIALGNGTATVIQPNSAAITITDNDPQPGTVALSAAAISVQENVGNAVITVNRTGSTVGAASVALSTAGNSAVAGTDFTAVNTTVNFADGETSKTVDVPVTNRTGFQGNRAFSASLSSPNGVVLGTTISADVTIQEDELPPAVALSAATYSVIETAGTIAIGLVRTGDPDTALTVTFAATEGSADDGRDFNVVNTAVNFAAGETTKNVTIDILDAAGFQGNNRTVNIALSNPTVGSLTAPSSAVLTITDNDAQPGGAVAGSYSGLISTSGASVPRLNNVGALALKVTPTGSFTGKVFIEGKALPVSGIFGADGVATFKGGGTTFPVSPNSDDSLRLTIFGDSIAGTLRDDDGDLVSVVTAERVVPYDGKTPATTVPVSILNLTTSKGFHTGVITLNPAVSQGALTTDKYPQGDGVLSFTVGKKGTFKVKGTLADGTKFSAASALNKLHSAPLFAQLYKKKTGLISVSLKFDATRADSDALGANLLWMRPADAAAKHYPDGWPAGITLDMLAARYRAPQKGDTTSAFPGLTGVPDNNDATLTAAGGKIASPGTITNAVEISTTNKVTHVPATDKDFKLTFSAKKGTLSGFFTHTDAANVVTKPKFTGIVFQKGPTAGGYGFFLSTVPKGQTTGESGGITLDADD